MILTSLLLGATAIVAVTAVAVFWNEIVEWLKRAVTRVQEIISGVVQGFSIFIKKMREAAKEISKHFSKVGTKWQETIVEKNISFNDLPDEIKRKLTLDDVECDFTNELALHLRQ